MQWDVRERWHSAGYPNRSRLHRHGLQCGGIRWTAGADEGVSTLNVHTMAKLIYSGIMLLDGYVADKAGKFDWSVPDAEVHTAINDFARSVGTFLLGRWMYEVLVAWEGMDVANEPDRHP